MLHVHDADHGVCLLVPRGLWNLVRLRNLEEFDIGVAGTDRTVGSHLERIGYLLERLNPSA